MRRRLDERWWAPAQIRFSASQVKWLLGHSQLLKLGQWPPVPSEKQYIPPRRRGRRKWAGFERVVDIAAELDQRMGALGREGAMLREHYAFGVPYETLARFWGMTERQVGRCLEDALKAVSGRERKVYQNVEGGPIDKCQ